jgi:hypothetical protein
MVAMSLEDLQFIVVMVAMSLEDHSWMYEWWNDNGCHSEEWVHNTNAFLDRACGSCHISLNSCTGITLILCIMRRK